MIQDFNSLSSDFRLYDLFGDASNSSVTQIWVLEIERENASELRFLYGRTLPGTFQSNAWNGTNTKNTPLYENCSVRIHTLTLHTSAEKLKVFFQSFIDGYSLHEASQHADLILRDKLNAKIGSVIFGTNPCVRPVMHLPTRDGFPLQTKRLSHTSYASVDSGAVFPEEKPSIFTVPEGKDRQIAEAACNALDTDTGMDFATLDAWRLGDLEFICAPGLTNSERRKFEIILKGKHSSLNLFESLTQEPADLMVIVNAYSNDSVQASYVARLDQSISYPLEHKFIIEDFKNQVTTAFTLEIYALGKAGEESYLLLKTGNYFVRGVNLNMQVVEPISSTDRMGWLEKQVPPREKTKLDATGRVARAVRSSHSVIGGHFNDPWVSQSCLIESNVHNLLPKASTGGFFLTLSSSGGTSRLHLVDWLRRIFERHHDAKIAWFDPFMEDVGINLLNRLGTANGDYLIITTEKQSNEDSELSPEKPTRIQRLLASCDGWSNGYFGNVQLKVLAVPDSKIHDRMILIRSVNGKPLAGYHLSNSIQRANDNFPLLATPIPLDILPSVFEFADGIIQSALHGDRKQSPTAKLIFDSNTYSPEIKTCGVGLNHQSSFIDISRSGDVFAWWLNDQELAGLSGSVLLDMMHSKKYMKDGELAPERFEELPSNFWNEGFPLQDFHSAWDVLGYVLAHSHAGSLFIEDNSPLSDELKQKLLEHLNPFRVDALPAKIKTSYLDIEHYRAKSLRELLLSNDEPSRVFCGSEFETAWSDYYALKILWSRAPQDLIDWLSIACSNTVGEHHRKRALVEQALNIICLELEFDKNPEKIEALLKSDASVVIWVGLHAFKNAINNGNFSSDALSKLSLIKPTDEQKTVLCWFINEANNDNSDAKSQLIIKLIQLFETPLNDKQLQNTLQPLRDRLGKLHHFTPWILESLLIPMIEMKVIDVAQVSRIWLGELMNQWRLILDGGDNLYFKIDGDGAFTDELATLMAHIDTTDQAYIISELWKIFNSLARTIRKPFSAQISWSSYIDAYNVNLWLYALSCRISFFVNCDENQQLKVLLEQSESLIERLSDSEREDLTNQDLLIYFRRKPDQIKCNNILNTVDTAIVVDAQVWPRD
ncbi:VPA1262 family protein [Shewanella sp. GD03713]|uniref:VPA1262 family protein n=1 Tax=Shewanella sp. GD03713 TaxID=2975372 RepID=UPI000B6A6494|nr:VPA1262 family protein [Shewanella sp. GD03713]MDH1472756.1 VPA1262 family protein [Shewanella sp. GD03713]QXN27349.1 hypothetical protein KVP08_021865 [Shewanella putrefaciens]